MCFNLDQSESPGHNGIILFIPGHPRPQPRPRAVNGRIVSVCDANARFWLKQVDKAASICWVNMGGCEGVELILGSTTALRVDSLFNMPSKRISQYGMDHTQVPDVDNLIKLVLDSIFKKNGLIRSGSDARVAQIRVQKKWCNPQLAGCTIVIKRLS